MRRSASTLRTTFGWRFRGQLRSSASNVNAQAQRGMHMRKVVESCTRRSPKFVRASTHVRRFSSSTPDSSSHTTGSSAVSVPLLEPIRRRIYDHGPMTVAEYMSVSLTHPEFGYYNVSGAKPNDESFMGDFVTSPEISQVFGELIGVWCVAMWQSALGASESVRIVELGPGRGTLMRDAMSAFASFPAFADALQRGGIHMVEKSEGNVKVQRSSLECTLQEPNGPWVSNAFKSSSMSAIPVEWHDEFRSYLDVAAGDDTTTIFLAHEYLDALPIHVFRRTDAGFREVMIDVDEEKVGESTEVDLKYVLSNRPTAAAAAALSGAIVSEETPETVEVSPASATVVGDMAREIARCSGAALLVDYGTQTKSGTSLRGIKDHKFVDALKFPGVADITADVDFESLKRPAEDVDGVYVAGPTTQSDFLSNMGIEYRVAALLEAAEARGDEDDALDLFQAYQRLVSTDDGGMGKVYHAMTLVSGDGMLKSQLPGFSKLQQD